MPTLPVFCRPAAAQRSLLRARPLFAVVTLLLAIGSGVAALVPQRAAPKPAQLTSTTVRAGDSSASLLTRLRVTDPAQRAALARLPALTQLSAAPGQPVAALVDGDGRLLRLSAQLALHDVENAATLLLQLTTQPDGAINTAIRLASLAPATGRLGEGATSGALASPLAFERVSSGWGWRINPIFNAPEFHLGVDLAAPVGTAVHSVADGRVSFAGSGRGYGNYVRIEHAGGRATVYAHLDRVDVRPGQRVLQGQIIGRSGNTGWSTGPHLYWQLFIDGTPVDPLTLARAAPRANSRS